DSPGLGWLCWLVRNSSSLKSGALRNYDFHLWLASGLDYHRWRDNFATLCTGWLRKGAARIGRRESFSDDAKSMSAGRYCEPYSASSSLNCPFLRLESNNKCFRVGSFFI